MLLQPLITPGLGLQSYLIADLHTKEAAIIDPVRTIGPLFAAIQEHRLKVRYLVETHVHSDFVSGAAALKEQLGGACVIACSYTGGAERFPQYADRAIQSGETLLFGSIRLQALAAPGPTEEHLIWLVFNERRHQSLPCAVFTGDLLLVGAYGKIETADPKLYLQLREKFSSSIEILFSQHDTLEIYPLHGLGSLYAHPFSHQISSTLGYERMSLDKPHFPLDFPGAPLSLEKITKQNLGGTSGLSKPSFIAPSEMATLNPLHAVVCDLRSPQEFAKAHFRGSINLPFKPAFPEWAASILPVHLPLYLILPEAELLPRILEGLQLVGFDQCQGYTTLSSAEKSLCSFPLLEPTDVSKGTWTVLDVRTPTEWSLKPFSGALQIELSALPRQLEKLPPRQSPLALLCRSGYRASVAASFLKREGFEQVCNIRGGIEALK